MAQASHIVVQEHFPVTCHLRAQVAGRIHPKAAPIIHIPIPMCDPNHRAPTNQDKNPTDLIVLTHTLTSRKALTKIRITMTMIMTTRAVVGVADEWVVRTTIITRL
jgi:hypothetical protein